MINQLLKIFDEQFPHLTNEIDLVMGGSPLTNKFFIGASKGEVGFHNNAAVSRVY
jgi:hypothetical protein